MADFQWNQTTLHFPMHRYEHDRLVKQPDWVRKTIRDGLRQPSIMHQIITLFKQWDENGDGRVSKAEFKRAMRALFGFGEADDDAVDDAFDRVDTDFSGEIEYRELYKAALPGGGL